MTFLAYCSKNNVPYKILKMDKRYFQEGVSMQVIGFPYELKNKNESKYLLQPAVPGVELYFTGVVDPDMIGKM